MKGERTDRLRRRPDKIRYFFLAVSGTTLHTGISYGGLYYAHTRHTVKELYLADLFRMDVMKVEEPIDDFMKRWRVHYNDPTWSYARDIEEGMPVPNVD